ncbi:sulfotransferase [Filomicrobium sp.]|uniref:sulfotransferase n=1 Tax=Filomicrobium sp. TaxID=2024831 RepID=UPI00258DC274|nr:sulfotransferase [Filomicrobium sp.]MCV0371474.1 sulfotransferase [Filomicrobium sp.]
MKYLVHIGYPKAASTWLQTHLFSGTIPSMRPLLASGKKNRSYVKSGGGMFYDHDDFGCFLNVFNFNAVDVRKKIKSLTDPAAQVTVLSNEGWCGHPFAGGVTGKAFSDRIYAVLPEATILIIVRNQLDMIVSAYLHFLTQEGGNLTLDEFIRPVKWFHRPSFTLSHLNYMNVIRYYDELFGRDRVVVVPFELITKSTESFVEPIFAALDLTAPESFSSRPENARNVSHAIAISLMPRLNSGHPAVQAAFESGGKLLSGRFVKRRKVEMIRFLDGVLGEYYKEDNRKLQERTGYDLESLKYVV